MQSRSHAPEMPVLAGQQQMGSQEAHAVTRQTAASKGAALASAHACVWPASGGEAAKAGRSCSTRVQLWRAAARATAGVQTTQCSQHCMSMTTNAVIE